VLINDEEPSMTFEEWLALIAEGVTSRPKQERSSGPREALKPCTLRR
jgi:hypothetical protein